MKKQQAARPLSPKALFALIGIALLIVVALIYQGGISADEQTASRPVSLINVEPSSGVVGTEVLIRGAGFSTEDNTVTMGSVTRSGLTSTDGTSILMYIPSDLDDGNYNVTVTNSKGKSNTARFTVTK